MVALALTAGLFVFWGVVGYGVQVLLCRQRWDALQRVLLAPAVGLACSVVLVFLLSRAGLPVQVFSPALAAVLVLGSAISLWRWRPEFPARAYLAFILVFVLALLATGRPLFQFGFDWISFANDDMANYVLGAQFLLNYGFPSTPDVGTLIQGTDYSLYYWFFFVARAIRPGSELLLAWLVGTTGLTGHQAFMPLILSFHLVLVSSTAAMVCRSRRTRFAAWLAACLLALSAMTAFGVLAQLMAQVAGLSLLAASATVLMRVRASTTGQAVRDGLLTGLLGSALLLVYPEVTPFLGLAFFLFSLVRLLRTRVAARPLLIRVGTSAGVCLVVINSYFADVFVFLKLQVTGGLRPSDAQSFIFPYFLLPSGLADFWGFQSIIGLPREPWLSLSIALGGLLLLLGLLASLRLAWHGEPAAVLATVMFAVGTRLATQEADFGIFKLAMFVQPFLLGTLTLACARWRRISWLPVPLAVIGLTGLFGLTAYVERSNSPYNEIPSGSQSHVATELRQALQGVQTNHLVVDSINISLVKFEALYTRGVAATFPSRDFFSSIIGRGLDASLLAPGMYESAQEGTSAVSTRIVPAYFALHDAADASAVNEFRRNTLGQYAGNDTACKFIETTGLQSVFNRSQYDPTDTNNFVIRPCASVRDHLIFVHSKLGQHYYQVDQRYFGEQQVSIGIFPIEPDPILLGRTMAGVGRNLLFEVVNPTPGARLMVDMSATLKGNGDDSLPPVAVIGEERIPLPTEGRGSARVVSPPLRPQVIDGHTYVAIDMGVDGENFPEQRTGLMKLYGSAIPFDRRKLVGFARNISLIEAEDYQRLAPPSRLAAFPVDLEQSDLEYSGVYEDGWVGEAAYALLSEPSTANVTVSGMVPLINDPNFTSELQVLVDGQGVTRQLLHPGDFSVTAPAPGGPRRGRIELRFSNFQHLPAPDGRPVAALLRSVGFEPAPD